ncbi:MAG: GHMP kinase [Desulfomonile tiedjei]|uniref:GHMP kinase n=1 Tax=Desulfomonile tiedjei TaxID=2358 RepID=A0A9D6Z2U1_9BACT|nr:GHMP kinase [Desulfomonile tiedjei]
MELMVTAPNRIDLAGGTTDLYPLYIFMEGGYTVNVAISIRSRVIFREHVGIGIKIFSEDLGTSTEASDPKDLSTDGPLGLIGRAVKTFPPLTATEILTHNEAPAGSGLGASSALLVALIKGLLRLRSEEEPQRELISLAVNTETSVIGVPAGSQDHIAALFGGISVLRFDNRSFQRRAIPEGTDWIERLEDMLVLSYTGEGRFSGMNNWEVTKNFIDNVGDTREKLLAIRDVARETGRVLMAGDLGKIPALVQKEWDIRRTLAPGISTPRIDSIMAATSAAGAQANKICGAGGGGCMVTICPPRQRSAVETAIAEAGGRVIPFRIDTHGTVVSELI